MPRNTIAISRDTPAARPLPLGRSVSLSTIISTHGILLLPLNLRFPPTHDVLRQRKGMKKCSRSNDLLSMLLVFDQSKA